MIFSKVNFVKLLYLCIMELCGPIENDEGTSLVVQGLKTSCSQCRRPGFDTWIRKIPWRKGMASHSSILAWRIPRTEEPGRLQSIQLQRVGHD